MGLCQLKFSSYTLSSNYFFNTHNIQKPAVHSTAGNSAKLFGVQFYPYYKTAYLLYL